MILGGLASFTSATPEPFIVQFQWRYINYSWPDEETYIKAKQEDAYIEKHNPLAGIKLYKDKMYLTIPRWRSGVPVTLAVTSSTPVDGQTAPRLDPFPNWEMQKVGDCKAFQFVQSMEIDPKGRMWVLDSGRTDTLTLEAKAYCPPRLVILDLENQGQILRSYTFPPDVAKPDSAYLNDIVLDHEDGGVAYISDTDIENPGIIVFSLQNRTSWKVTHDSMRPKSDAVSLRVSGTLVTKPVAVDGIALSPASTEGNRVLYYTPLSSFSLFSIPTWVLKNPNSELIPLSNFHMSQEHNITHFIKNLGMKPSQSDGMMMSASGVLYFGLLGDDAVSMWDTRHPSFTTGQRIISRDHHLMQWPDTFAFDEKGQLWLITNRLQTFLTNTVDVKVPNYRAIMSRTYQKSYQFYENGSYPDLPDIPAGAYSHLLSSREGVIMGLIVALMQFQMLK